MQERKTPENSVTFGKFILVARLTVQVNAGVAICLASFVEVIASRELPSIQHRGTAAWKRQAEQGFANAAKKGRRQAG